MSFTETGVTFIVLYLSVPVLAIIGGWWLGRKRVPDPKHRAAGSVPEGLSRRCDGFCRGGWDGDI